MKARSHGKRAEVRPAMAGVVAVVLWAALLLFAPPDSNLFWGVNGLRSIGPAAALLVLGASAFATFIALHPPRSRLFGTLLAVAAAGIVAFALSEKSQFLGDTSLRQAAVMNHLIGYSPRSFGVWARQLHAQPLDLLTSLYLTSTFARAVGSLPFAISATSFLLVLAYFAGTWRLAGQIAAQTGVRAGLCVALVAWGGLQAFAGYAESAGIALVAGAWFWAALLAPIDRPRAGLVLAATWFALAMSHRIGFALLLPLAVRVALATRPEDTREGRALAATGSFVALALALAPMAWGRDARLTQDVAELLRWPSVDELVSVPSDLANLFALIAPLALLAPWVAGRFALRAAWRDPAALPLVAAAVVLMPLAFPLPIADSGLGVQRDWDLSVLLGFALTVAGALVLARLPRERSRGALTMLLPVLIAGSVSFVAANGMRAVAVRRIAALRDGRPPLSATHRSALLAFLGDHALDRGQPREAAMQLTESWRLVPSPTRGLHAAAAWLRTGEPDSARVLLAAVRARGLSGTAAISAESLAARIERFPRD